MDTKGHVLSCLENGLPTGKAIHEFLDQYASALPLDIHRDILHHEFGVLIVRAMDGDLAASIARQHILDDEGHIPRMTEIVDRIRERYENHPAVAEVRRLTAALEEARSELNFRTIHPTIDDIKADCEAEAKKMFMEAEMIKTVDKIIVTKTEEIRAERDAALTELEHEILAHTDDNRAWADIAHEARTERDAALEREAKLLDLAEMAWGIIANAYGGNWDLSHPDWKQAAEKWRNQYHAALADADLYDHCGDESCAECAKGKEVKP